MKELVIRNMPKLPFDVTEALNQFRINLGFCGDEVKTIMVTSSLPNEGKSFLVMQLWRMMAEVGTPTLLIDCDYRNSEMRTKYGISSTEKIVGGRPLLGWQSGYVGCDLSDQYSQWIYDTNHVGHR